MIFDEIFTNLSDKLTACMKIKLAFAKWIYKMMLQYLEMNMNFWLSDKICLAANLINNQTWDLSEIIICYLLYTNWVWWLTLDLINKLIIAF